MFACCVAFAWQKWEVKIAGGEGPLCPSVRFKSFQPWSSENCGDQDDFLKCS
jgi:hypothetical protein